MRKGITTLVFALIILFSFHINCFSQGKIKNPFRMVEMPDSVVLKLEESYKKNASDVNAGRNVFNLQDRKKNMFGNGIYSFQGQGPHFPRRLFVFNKDKLYIFNSEGSSNPKGVMKEFVQCIEEVNLSNKQIVEYARILGYYLKEEESKTYGDEIK